MVSSARVMMVKRATAAKLPLDRDSLPDQLKTTLTEFYAILVENLLLNLLKEVK